MYKKKPTIAQSSILSLAIKMLFISLSSLLAYAQPTNEHEVERINKIAEEYFQQQSLGGTQVTTPNRTEAIQVKFFTGAAAGDQFGYSVSTAGDVNGDGYEDIIVGAPFYGSNDNGRAYIYYGGITLNSIADVIITGTGTVDYLGNSVSSAGDVNGDGYSDVIVGAYGYSITGRAYIYFGGVHMDNVEDITLTGTASGDIFGSSVSTAGDLNGDGYSDVIVGAYGYNSWTGRAYIYLGGSNMNNTADAILTGAAAGHYFGNSVSTAGDLNGDGYSDVIVGAYGVSSFAGSAYIYFGGAALDNTADVILIGSAGELLGQSVSTAQDVNGDGYSDVIVGAVGYSSYTGRSLVYFGGVSMDNIADVTLTGAIIDDNFGVSVSTAGDVNGDGYSDVIIGAFQNDAGGSNAGRAYIYFGGVSMDNVGDVVLTGAAVNENFGISVSTAGDINGDGYSDLIVGARFNAGTGRAYLYTNSLTGTDIPDEFFTGLTANDQFGTSVSSAGDVNGDGYMDLIVGAPFNDVGGTDAGRAYIYLGGEILNNAADVTLTGHAANDYFGYSVSSAGDVNGDGFADVIVGAYLSDSNGVDAGRAYIFLGGASMDNIADIIMTGLAAGDDFGFSVSNAGDVNGDGYNDVVVGAHLNDGGGSDAGRAYIFYGGSPMNNAADKLLTGASADDRFGYSVSSAGDINGDGFCDVIIGATQNDAAATNAGRAYIYYGAVNMDLTADVILNGEAANDWFGYNVSFAGDVNGDGYPDVLVASPFNDAAGADAGRVYIFFGGMIMNNAVDVVLTGEAANDWFGRYISTAGDVNADGFSDVIIGAIFNDASGNDAGRTYIYFGSTSMDNAVDIVMTGAVAVDYFGSVSYAGDINRDGFSDIIIGAPRNDAGGTNAGRAYLYLSSAPGAKPRIMSLKDVPGDQGGFVNLNFVRSGYDSKGINKITQYIIERSNPPGIGGFFWSQIGTVTPIQNQQYAYIASTPNDSSSSTSGLFFFRITARTNNPDEYWRSNIMSGHSLDNLAPVLVKNFNGTIQGVNNKLTWKENTEPDLKNYHLYRATSPTIDPDTMTAFFVTTDTTGLDISVPPGDMYYFIRARDTHDNFGPLAQINTPLPLRQINFTALIEGFYDIGSNTMVEDTVEVILKNTTAPYTTIDQGKVKLNTSGNGLVKFRQAANGTNYYLVVKHRNALETWSKLGQQFSNSEMTYDFTTSANKAYGDNMKLKGSKWTIFSGDVNQDGGVDLTDMIIVDNDNANFVTGYVPSDVNGDNSSDLSDMIIVDNNNAAFVGKVVPPGAVTSTKLREQKQSYNESN